MPVLQIQAEIQVLLETFKFEERGLSALVRGPIVQDLVRRAILIESAAKQNASQPHQGGDPDLGSVPGGGPAVRTGRLRGSITWRLGQDTEGPYADIGTAVHYGPYVELGTQNMEARPYLRPALRAGSF